VDFLFPIDSSLKNFINCMLQPTDHYAENAGSRILQNYRYKKILLLVPKAVCLFLGG
jgi:hypothetical protein